MTKVTDAGFGPGWEERLLQQLIEDEVNDANSQAYDEGLATAVPAHELMFAEEVLAKLRISLPTLYRNTKSRKLPYIKRDGRLMFRRADVERYDAKRYHRAK